MFTLEDFQKAKKRSDLISIANTKNIKILLELL